MNSGVQENFVQAVSVLFSGMGGIFAVLLLIFVVIKVLIKVFPEK